MKRFLPFFAIGLALRLLVMPASLHPDFRAVNLAGYLIAQKHELFSFYDYISRLPRNHDLVNLYGDNLFIYPPLAYLVHGLVNFFLFPFYPQEAFWTLITDIGNLWGQPGVPWLLILLKLPYLLADLAVLALLSRILAPSRKFLGQILWWLNPVSIYTSYLVGQFDIFLCLFIVLSLYFLSTKKPWLSAVMLGLASGFKPFPLLFLPFLPGSIPKNLLLCLGTYFLIIAPFLSSPAFKQYALMASQSDKMLYAKIMVSGSQYLSLFVVGFTLLLLGRLRRHSALPVWGWFLSVCLLFYSLTHFHPQWYLWAAPLYLLSWVKFPSSRLVIGLHIGLYFLLVCLFDPSLNFGLIGLDFSLHTWLGQSLPGDLVASVARSIFAAGSLYLVWLISSLHDLDTKPV